MQLDKHCRDLAQFTSITSLSLMGGEGFREQQAKLRKNPEFVIGTPGRLLEHARKKSLLLDDLEFLVLDEADRILDMGFREEVLDVISHCGTNRQTILLSATLDHKGIAGISREIQQTPQSIAIGTHRSAHDNIDQQIILADDPGHKKQLCNWLLANENFLKALVFTNTREHAEDLAVFLVQQGHRAWCLHGEMQQDERKQVMARYRDSKTGVLVATDLAARGLDIPSIELVINFSMARSGDEYVHRIGRTGRAGEKGTAISLIAPQQWNLMESIERYLNLAFTRRQIKELPAKFSGPAAKKKKKTNQKKKQRAGDKAKPKQRHRDRKNIGKRRKPSAIKQEEAAGSTDAAGLAPLQRPKRKRQDSDSRKKK